MLQRACTRLSSADTRSNRVGSIGCECVGTLKAEFYHMHRFRTLDELKAGLRGYIDYYDYDRMRRNLEEWNPVEYRAAI
jgi:hypothetical protein